MILLVGFSTFRFHLPLSVTPIVLFLRLPITHHGHPHTAASCLGFQRQPCGEGSVGGPVVGVAGVIGPAFPFERGQCVEPFILSVGFRPVCLACDCLATNLAFLASLGKSIFPFFGPAANRNRFIIRSAQPIPLFPTYLAFRQTCCFFAGL